MLRVRVGSKNKAKVAAVTAAVAAYWPDAHHVEGEDVASGVPDQPLGLEQTMEGALNRARAAFALGGVDLGVGLEGGVMEIYGQPVMLGCVAVCDGVREIVVPGNGTPLPHAWGEALKAGAELRPFVIASGLEYDYTAGVVGILTRGQIMRDEAFSATVKTALAPWVNPDVYQ